MNKAQQSSINPAFAGHVSDKLRELSGDLHRVFDNLLEIARGDDPKANGYDRLRATRILYDRGLGKVTRNQARTNANSSANGASPEPKPKIAAAKRPSPSSSRNSTTLSDHPRPLPSRRRPLLSLLKPVLSGVERSRRGHTAYPPQAPTPRTTPPDLVRDSQYYVLEITTTATS